MDVSRHTGTINLQQKTIILMVHYILAPEAFVPTNTNTNRIQVSPEDNMVVDAPIATPSLEPLALESQTEVATEVV